MRPVLKALGIAGLLALVSGGVSAQGIGIQVDAPDRAERRMDRMERGERMDRGDRMGRMNRDMDRRSERTGSVEVREERFGGPRVIERRVVRGAPARRTVCRTEVRQRVRPNGAIVTRPIEVCRTVVGNRF